MANGSRHAMYLVEETGGYGVTPATPALKKIRHNTTNLAVAKNIFRSEELRSDRMPSGVKYGTRQSGGEIVTELTHGGSVHDILQALLCGTWTANVLKSGVTRRSFSVLRDFEDLGAGQKRYHLYKGQEFNTMKLSMSSEGIVMATYGLIGMGNMAPAAAAPAGATYPAVTTGDSFDAFSGAILEGGAAIAVVTEVELNLENGIEPRFVVGNRDTLRPTIGRSLVTGQITAHFETDALLDKFITEAASDLTFTVGAGADTLTFDIPKLKYTGGQPDISGEGSILLTMPFEAEYSSADGSQLVITRSGA